MGERRVLDAVVARVDHDGVVRNPHGVQPLEDRAHLLVMLDHARAVGIVVARELPCLLLVLLRHPRKDVHAGGREPGEERLALRLRLVHELDARLDEFLIDGLHALARQRTGVDDPLLAHLAESGIDGLIHGVGGPGVQHPARSKTSLELGIARVVLVFGLLLGVQVIQVAEELVESVQRRQVFVPVTQVVLAELPRGVALRLQHLGERCVVGLHADGPPDHAHRRQARADRIHARDERGTPGGAGRMRIVIGEHRAFVSNAIDVRCAVAHDTATVDTEVGEADVVAPDDDDVRLRRWRRLGRAGHQTCECQGCDHQSANGSDWHG
jgi:hypothetical protein